MILYFLISLFTNLVVLNYKVFQHIKEDLVLLQGLTNSNINKLDHKIFLPIIQGLIQIDYRPINNELVLLFLN